jgi:hypothetical protein
MRALAFLLLLGAVVVNAAALAPTPLWRSEECSLRLRCRRQSWSRPLTVAPKAVSAPASQWPPSDPNELNRLRNRATHWILGQPDDDARNTGREFQHAYRDTLGAIDRRFKRLRNPNNVRDKSNIGDELPTQTFQVAFQHWLMTTHIEPLIERQIADSLTERLGLVRDEIGMVLPVIYASQDPKIMAIYAKATPEFRRVFKVVVEADHVMRSIGRLLRQAILLNVVRVVNGASIAPLLKSLGKVVASQAKPPAWSALKDRREFMTATIEQIHLPIMRELDNALLDNVICYFADQIAVFGAQTVQSFFALVIESIQAGKAGVHSRITESISAGNL